LNFQLAKWLGSGKLLYLPAKALQHTTSHTFCPPTILMSGRLALLFQVCVVRVCVQFVFDVCVQFVFEEAERLCASVKQKGLGISSQNSGIL